ncbi:5'-methylthioadenosine/S-adenosylhomocysteine nucleosidase family protein [Saccharothrix coeruleofusca]|uniref:5'-methylthioadenosine/S-adenosylhomocysteine nucleosidase family protein n=1 Tax=Saccharothrix coeruleofusca TaxID=33919 RepID=UPI001E461A54|nr:5'-methylthioadenosine/S-adenosylhomocysteine nucleosidase [Saccharothrix coeruleofusca]
MILTALQVEQRAVLEHLVDVEPHRHAAGTIFDVGTLAGQRNRRVALGVTGPGALGAATLTERAFAEFSPSAMMFVGVAGGLRDWLEIGDVVVATKVYSYHGGRSEDEEFLVRPRAWEISHAVEQTARRLPRDNAWAAALPETPGVHFEAIAAGDVVLNSTTSPVARKIRRNFNDAVAIEMESSGFALAGHLSGKVPMVTVRAISDRADGTKSTTDREGGQRVAARNAAAFAVALAAALDDDETPGGTAGAPGNAPTLPTIRSTSVARDNAHVGQQIGVNFGAGWPGGGR